ncbi:hypothetical protein AAVH_02915 [Aphelenchoides avenae]|nr:hypothetical protein AAVH_02915 [Aphelenchus avenae]
MYRKILSNRLQTEVPTFLNDDPPGLELPDKYVIGARNYKTADWIAYWDKEDKDQQVGLACRARKKARHVYHRCWTVGRVRDAPPGPPRGVFWKRHAGGEHRRAKRLGLERARTHHAGKLSVRSTLTDLTTELPIL